MKKYPCISGLALKRRSIFVRHKSLYLKAEKDDIVLLWIEEENAFGKGAYPCVYACRDGIFCYFTYRNADNSEILERWSKLTAEQIADGFTLQQLDNDEFVELYNYYMNKSN